MTRPTAGIARMNADAYATRAILIELLRLMQDANPAALGTVMGQLQHATLRPDDIAVADPHIRHAVKMILDEAAK
jgi:hypothetical protein